MENDQNSIHLFSSVSCNMFSPLINKNINKKINVKACKNTHLVTKAPRPEENQLIVVKFFKVFIVSITLLFGRQRQFSKRYSVIIKIL